MIEFYQWASNNLADFIIVTFIITAAIVLIIEAWREK